LVVGSYPRFLCIRRTLHTGTASGPLGIKTFFRTFGRTVFMAGFAGANQIVIYQIGYDLHPVAYRKEQCAYIANHLLTFLVTGFGDGIVAHARCFLQTGKNGAGFLVGYFNIFKLKALDASHQKPGYDKPLVF
jgi:hypothetical protein